MTVEKSQSLRQSPGRAVAPPVLVPTSATFYSLATSGAGAPLFTPVFQLGI